MKPYKLKHIPTGLYYKPVGGSISNLSKNGKIYQTKTNALFGNGDTITISITEKQYNDNKEIFDSLVIWKTRRQYNVRCNKIDFEIEYL